MLDWFAGGTPRYMTLYHCMNQDLPWVMLTVVLDLAVACGYMLIALHWWRQQRGTKKSLAHRALGNMKNIFVFCGICGYVFIPIKMVWPAWRLYDLFLVILVFYTWRYAWSARELKVIYDELTRSEELKRDVVELQAESRRKSFFLNSLSHDLRTPLNGLMLQAQLAEMTLDSVHDDPEAVAELAESLAAIVLGAKTTAEMLDGFLDLGRLDWGEDVTQEETFGVLEALGKVASMSSSMAETRGLALLVEAREDLTLTTDRAKLERILLNLTSNALKYSEHGEVRLEAAQEGPNLRIVVSDTGLGIAPEHLPRLFEEFYQVHNHERDRNKGFGLGLSIASRLAGQLGGRGNDRLKRAHPGAR